MVAGRAAVKGLLNMASVKYDHWKYEQHLAFYIGLKKYVAVQCVLLKGGQLVHLVL